MGQKPYRSILLFLAALLVIWLASYKPSGASNGGEATPISENIVYVIKDSELEWQGLTDGDQLFLCVSDRAAKRAMLINLQTDKRFSSPDCLTLRKNGWRDTAGSPGPTAEGGNPEWLNGGVISISSHANCFPLFSNPYHYETSSGEQSIDFYLVEKLKHPEIYRFPCPATTPADLLTVKTDYRDAGALFFSGGQNLAVLAYGNTILKMRRIPSRILGFENLFFVPAKWVGLKAGSNFIAGDDFIERIKKMNSAIERGSHETARIINVTAKDFANLPKLPLRKP